jgi:hypothetical protein
MSPLPAEDGVSAGDEPLTGEVVTGDLDEVHLAAKNEVTERYVQMICSGERTPGKALKAALTQVAADIVRNVCPKTTGLTDLEACPVYNYLRESS